MRTIQDSPVGSDGQTVFSPPLFGIRTAKEDGSYVICVEGELDLSDCPRLERTLQDAEASPAARILLDLDGLAFIDAAGLSVLVAAWHRSAADGNRLRVTRAGGSVANMLHRTALDTVLPFVGETP